MKLGSSKLKQRAQLKTTAPNNDWFRNVIKSVGYASADIIKETIPSTFEFVESNGRDGMDLYQQLREDGPKSITKMLAQGVEKNEYLRIAKDAVTNIKDDLKTGKIYNKEREERAVLGDDGDFDFSFGGDDDFSFGGDDDMDFESSEDSNGNVTNVKNVTVNNINANITKNNPMVKSLERQSEVMVGLTESTNKSNVALATTGFTLTSRIASDVMTGIATVNDNLTALVNFNNDSMSKYVAASLQYYEDSLTVLKQTLELNTPKAPEEKIRPEEEDIFLGNGGLNIKNYAQRVKKNVKTTIESDLMLNSIYGMVSDTDTIKMLAANPLKAIPMAISKVVIPGVVRESAKQFDETFSAFFPALLQKFNRMANQDGNWLMKTVGQIFGINNKNSTTVEIDKYNKGDMNFNGITQKAITEVIPTYLRKILAAVSGSNEMVFDYQKAKFVDYMEASENSKKERRDASLSGMSTYQELKERLNAIEFTDEKYKQDMMKEFESFMYKLSRSAGGINPNVYKNKQGERVDEFKDFYSSEFTEIFRSAILSLSAADQMKLMGSDIFNAKANYGRKIDEIQNNIGASIFPVLEAWDSTGDYEKVHKTGKYRRKDPFGHIAKDKYDKTALDYMREMRNILLEGVVVFPSGGDFRGGRRRRGGSPNGGFDPRATDIINSRRSRLDDVGRENQAQTRREQEENTRVIKSYSDSELRGKAQKGIKVVSSTADLTADMDTNQMVDMFKNYVQIRDMDEETNVQQQSAGSWISKILGKGSKKVQSARDLFDNVLSLPGRVVSNVLKELDGGLYKLVFGVNQDGSDRSFLSKVTTSIKESFGGFFDWTKEKFFKPIHEALFGEDGFFTKIKNSEAMQKLKAFGAKMADWTFGEADENGHRRNGALSDAFNEVADLGKEVKSVFTGKEYVDKDGNVHEAKENSVFGNVNNFTRQILDESKTYLFGNRQKETDESVDTPSEQSGNGGGNILTNVMSWLKDNLSLRYKVSSDGQEGNSNTIRFGESVDEESAKGGFAPTILNGFPYFSQRDPRYANYAYNLSTGKGGGDSLAFGDRGCGPTALAMVASGMGRNVDPIDMANVATQGGFSVEGGTKGSFFSSIGDSLGLNVKEKQTGESGVNAALRQGQPIIFRGRKTTDNVTPFTNEGHFVVGYGGRNGKVNINDPNGTMTSGEYDIKDIVSESNKMWTFDDTGKGGGSRFGDTGKGPTTETTEKKSNGIGNWRDDIKAKDENGHFKGVFGEFAEGFRAAGDDFIKLAFGENTDDNEDQETKAKRFGNKFREMLPKGLAGGMIGGGLGTVVAATGGMGLLGSLFLPGGPVGAAVLGTAVGFASQSDKFKDWLFGKKDPEDTSKRLGGFISEKTQKFFKDNKNVIIGGAAIGGLKGILTGAGLLPSLLFGGPLTGAIMGAGVGLVVRSEKFQNMIFGEDDPETGKKIGGMLSKSYNAISDNKKLIGGAGIGLLGGAATGAVLSSMGIMGSAFFLGPVGGAITGAGLGIAAASEKWRDRVFGKFNEETNKREGGLLQEVKNNIITDVLEPIKLGAIETADSFKFWVEEKVMLPIADFFGPMKTALGMMMEDTLWKIQDIGAGIKSSFEKFVAEPMGTFLREKIFDPIRGLFGKLWKGATKITQMVLGSPFKVLDFANQRAAGWVQKRARKRKKKSDAAAEKIALYEERMTRGEELSLEEQIKYENLKKTRDRYFIAEDDARLTAKDNYKENKAARIADIRRRKEEAKLDLNAKREDLNKRREFRQIFGSEFAYNEEALEQYKSLFRLEDGKKIRGRRAKKALRSKADEFIMNFKSSGGQVAASEDVADMKTEIKENLNPMRKLLMSIDSGIKTLSLNIQNAYGRHVNKMMGGEAPDKSAVAVNNVVKRVNPKTNTKNDDRKKLRLPSPTNALMHWTDDKLNEARVENERIKVQREMLKVKNSGDGKGGRKDPSWLMFGKGDEDTKPEKKKGFLSSLGNSMFSALKRFDKVNDKEEAEKAEQKEVKAKLAEKQKAVSSKSYSAIQEKLITKRKEDEERDWKDKLLTAVTSIKEKAGEHTSEWKDIFSKKGLLTAGLLLAVPKILEFLKDPAKFLGDMISSALNNIKISIDWLFGHGNEARTDANGETVENSGLKDATGRLARNAAVKGAKYLATDGTVGNKLVKATGRVGSSLFKTGKELAQSLTLSDGTRELLNAGMKGSDNLAKFGVQSADDLVMFGVKTTDDLAALGLKTADDLAKVGIRTGDDLAKFGVELGSNKAKKQLSKVGIKITEELTETNILKDGAKKTLKETAGTALGKVSKAGGETISTVVNSAKNVTQSKFVTAIMDWFKEVFTSKAIVKQLGESAAAKTLKEMTEKVTKAFSETVLAKYSVKISAAIAEATGRAAGGAATLGVVTVAFGVADFVSGAVNTERLFEIPAGTATWEMRTISAILQTALGIGMVGPIIDVANEIIAEVTGINLLSLLAVTMYKFFVSEDKEIELDNLQQELDAAYTAYKEVNGLENFSKRAYIDMTNPSFGTKIVNGAKSLGHGLTGDFFNGNKIRQTLGKEDGEKITISDRLSQLTGNVMSGITFGKIDSTKATQKVAETFNNGKQWISDTWDGTKKWASDAWGNTKKWASNAWGDTKKWASNAWGDTKKWASKTWDGTKENAAKLWSGAKSTAKKAGHYITGDMFNDAEIRRQLGLNDNADITMKDRIAMGASNLVEKLTFGKIDSERVIDNIYGLQVIIADKAQEVWGNVKETTTKAFNSAKAKVSDAMTATGKKITGLMGLYDENGEPLPFTEGMTKLKDNTVELIKTKVKTTKENASKWWEDTKTDMAKNWEDTKRLTKEGMSALNTRMGGWFGFEDDAGNPLSLTDGIKHGITSTTLAIKDKYASIKQGASDWWEQTKNDVAENWTKAKENTKKAMTTLNNTMGGWFGFQDDDGNSLSLTDGITHAKNKFLETISENYRAIAKSTSEWWKDAKTQISDTVKTWRDNLTKGLEETNKALGKFLGFEDKNGNPLSLTEGVKQKWSDTVDSAQGLWNSFKTWVTNGFSATSKAASDDIAQRNANNYGTGGFGGETMPFNIGARGCGPTAMAMVASRMTGASIDPVAMSNLATQGGFAGSYGTNGAYFSYAANQFGISSNESKTTKENLTRALSSGQPVILRGQSNGNKDSVFTRAGHYVVAVGAKDGKVIINDPRGENYSGAYDMSDVVSQSNVMWSFGNARGAYDRPGTPVFGGSSVNTIPGELLLQYALIHKGKPYVWGANGPNSFDCSGLVNYVAKQAGVKLPGSRPTAEVWRKHTTSIKKSDLKVGDLGFLVKGGKATHVGIYAGDGLWCHAEGGPGEKGAGGSVVLNNRTYWTHFGRIPGVSGNTSSYSETSGVTSLAFNNGASQSSGTSSLLSNISGYLTDVFNTGINSAISGQLGTFSTFSEYLANNNSSSSSSSMTSFTDTVGTVSLGSRKTTADLLNKTLGGRLAGKGSAIVSIGNKYGVDPAFLAAILHHESGNGTSSAIINKNNPGGIMDASTNWSKLKHFATLEEGIEYTASNLKRNYLDKGLTTIEKIGSKYAPVGAANDPRGLNKNWVPNVTSLYNKYSSETGYGGFGEGFAPNTQTTFRFSDKMSEFGGMGDYIRVAPSTFGGQSESSSQGDDKVVSVMETMVDVLKTIAENTGVTNSKIGQAMSAAINKISTTNSNVSVNNVTTNGNRTINTSSTYNAKEIENRNIAERIAAGKFA